MSALLVEVQQAVPLPEGITPERIQDWFDVCFPDGPEQSVVVRITDAQEGAELNQAYRGKAGPTNVLSFPFEAPPGIPVDHLGDLVVCAPVVLSEAAGQGKSVEQHLAHLIVHGVLHLLGYDHLTDEEAAEMEAIEVALLARIGVPNPYE